MAVKSNILGPGHLKFGATGSEVEIATGIRSVSIGADTETGDPVPVLSGDEIFSEETTTWTLSGTILDSYDRDSFHIWAHLTAGQEIPFVFRPDTNRALGYHGTVKVRPMPIGGEVKTRVENDFEFPILGTPTLWDYTTPETPTQITEYTPATPAPVIPPEGVDPDGSDWA